MSSLRQLSAKYASMLVLDAASSRVQVGCIRSHAESTWKHSEEEAGIAVFRLVESLGIAPLEIDAFLYCSGPGSILGIRTVAMALRTWRVLRPAPIFAYCSLAVVAHALGQSETSVIADARRDWWHEYHLGGRLRRIPAAELRRPLVLPMHFRHWSPLPSEVRTVPYALAEQFSRIPDADLFEPSEYPDAFLHEEPSYARWSPQIHRGPSAR